MMDQVKLFKTFLKTSKQVTLINCEAICPAMPHALINTYSSNSCLFVDGHWYAVKNEGTAQGDPLAMAMFAIGARPLIHRLDGIALPSKFGMQMTLQLIQP